MPDDGCCWVALRRKSSFWNSHLYFTAIRRPERDYVFIFRHVTFRKQEYPIIKDVR